MRRAWLLLLAGAATACAGEPGAPADGAGVPPALASSAALPERFGFARPATAAEIARIDIDIGPDGRGLPPGRGSVAEGAALYQAQCAICHGPQGEGTPIGAALIDQEPVETFDFGTAEGMDRVRTVGSYWPHATTLFDYIRRAMPFDRPGSLSDDQVYALSAYLLHRNRILAEDAVLDSAALARVRMPARDRFVPDDREDTNRVR